MNNEAEANLELARIALKEAEHLRSGGYPRGTANRGYYAIHWAAVAMLCEEGFKFKSHGEVIGAFGRLFAKTGRVETRFHRHFKDAFEFRGVVDYDSFPEPPITMEKAVEVLSWATEFVAMAEEFLKSEGETGKS